MKEFDKLTRNYYITMMPAAVMQAGLMFFSTLPFYVTLPVGAGVTASMLWAGFILAKREMVYGKEIREDNRD